VTGGTGAATAPGPPEGGTGAATALDPPDGGTGAAEAPGVPDAGTGAGVRPDGVAEARAAVSASRVAAGWLVADATARPAPPATRAATGTPSQVIVRLREVLMLGQPPIQPAAMAGGRDRYRRDDHAVARHRKKCELSPARGRHWRSGTGSAAESYAAESYAAESDAAAPDAPQGRQAARPGPALRLRSRA
jgi:hypothetical protein